MLIVISECLAMRLWFVYTCTMLLAKLVMCKTCTVMYQLRVCNGSASLKLVLILDKAFSSAYKQL